jgi:hypothetical protein
MSRKKRAADMAPPPASKFPAGESSEGQAVVQLADAQHLFARARERLTQRTDRARRRADTHSHFAAVGAIFDDAKTGGAK